MGLFDFLRPKPRLRAKDLASHYGLRYTRSDNPTVAGSVVPNWWIGEVAAEQITFREHGGALEVVVGEMLAAVDNVLARVTAKRPLPPSGSEARLDAKNQSGHPVLSRWFFTIIPHGRAEPGLLERPDVLEALGGLSANINELAIYRWGVEFRFPASATADALHRDVRLAVRIRKPMEPYRQAHLASKRAAQ